MISIPIRALTLLATALVLLPLATACSRNSHDKGLAAQFQTQLAHLRKTHHLDASANSWIDRTMRNGSEKARADLALFLAEAVRLGATTKVHAEAIFTKMLHSSTTQHERQLWAQKLAQMEAGVRAQIKKVK